jgi:citrate/tricarballylate utilization protein
VRVEDYRRYLWPRVVPRPFRGWTGLFVTSAIAVIVVLLVALIHAGPAGLVAGHETAASPYDLIPYPALLVLILIPAAGAVTVLVLAGRAYLLATGSSLRELTVPALARALWNAATLRYLRGGGGDCYYPEDDRPSPLRRLLHGSVAYGFGLCFVSTIAAAVAQDIAGSQPPYPLVSAPVISGVVAGAALLAGCTGSLVLKARSSDVTSVADMTIKDYGLISGLAILAVTGLLTLALRDTPAFGIIFLVHIATVLAAFVLAPYSKFVHVLFRFLALLQDSKEQVR